MRNTIAPGRCDPFLLNIILFSPAEVELPLPRRDPRAGHILEVLRRRAGGTFDAGLIDGPRGQGTLVEAGPTSLKLAFVWGAPPPPLSPLALLGGLPRPQTARDILREATALGVAAIHFVRTERGEAAYAASSLWRTGAWREQVVAGAAQAFCTRLPAVTHGLTLAEATAALPAQAARIALDNYESTVALGEAVATGSPAAALALGAERGWSEAERNWLRDHGYVLAHLGRRVLRTETACIAAITLLKARLGWL